LCNDAVQLEKYKSHIKLKYRERHRSLPAVKLTRLGVPTELQDNHVGTKVLNMVKKFFITDNRTGCRIITVDAYNKPRTLKFYTDNLFQVFDDEDKNEQTRSMYFDLIRQKTK
jgi:hypothetical protein